MTSPIHKAIFPVAGLGTRFLPATKSTPKEMLPIVDKPLIQYAAEEAVAAGAETLVFITSRMKHSISDHFDTAFELESRLQRAGKSELLRRCREVLPAPVARLYIPQGDALGLGHAVLCAKPAVGDEAFHVLLADDLILNPGGANCAHQLAAAHLSTGASVVAVEPIDDDGCSRYGVIDIAAESGGLFRLTGIVEKPGPEAAPSRWGVVGRYVLTPGIFTCLEKQPLDERGEIQLTAALADLLFHEPVYALPLAGRRFDCGSRHGYLQATIEIAWQDPVLRNELHRCYRRLVGGVGSANGTPQVHRYAAAGHD